MRVLVIGANGMLGNAAMNFFGSRDGFEVIGSVREKEMISSFSPGIRERIISGIDILDESSQKRLFSKVAPNFVINCVGLVKQAKDANDSYRSILLNAMLPHQLARHCRECGAKLLQISTDCVFSGLKGAPYIESDDSDASDLYGRTKYLGEIASLPEVLTLRTSYIGNEIQTNNGLLEWFLSQEDECQGYTNAIYSGLPTIVLMEAIEDILVKYPELSGLFHVSSEPISKYNLLSLVANVFQKKINIVPNADLKINRSLDSSLFSRTTGFIAPPWELMVKRMYLDRMTNVQK
jgi:dTDP-4-dehydrorhamnose reductase